jgi:hypothetical protein
VSAASTPMHGVHSAQEYVDRLPSAKSEYTKLEI